MAILGTISIVCLYIFYAVLKLIIRTLEKKCTWCNLRGMKFMGDEDGGGMWMYQKTDGTKDLRYSSNNSYHGWYNSKNLCKICGALTSLNYTYIDSKSNSTFSSRRLITAGKGSRTGSDKEAFEVFKSIKSIVIVGFCLFIVWLIILWII